MNGSRPLKNRLLAVGQSEFGEQITFPYIAAARDKRVVQFVGLRQRHFVFGGGGGFPVALANHAPFPVKAFLCLANAATDDPYLPGRWNGQGALGRGGGLKTAAGGN